MLTTRLPAIVAGADAQASVSERKPTGTPASAHTSAASRLTASLLSGSIGQAMRLMIGRRRSSSAPPATARAISTARRVVVSPTTSTAWKCLLVLAKIASSSCSGRVAGGTSSAVTTGPQ